MRFSSEQGPIFIIIKVDENKINREPWNSFSLILSTPFVIYINTCLSNYIHRFNHVSRWKSFKENLSWNTLMFLNTIAHFYYISNIFHCISWYVYSVLLVILKYFQHGSHYKKYNEPSMDLVYNWKLDKAPFLLISKHRFVLSKEYFQNTLKFVKS